VLAKGVPRQQHRLAGFRVSVRVRVRVRVRVGVRVRVRGRGRVRVRVTLQHTPARSHERTRRSALSS